MVGHGGVHGPRRNAERDERRRALEARIYGGDEVTQAERAELRSLLSPAWAPVVGSQPATAAIDDDAGTDPDGPPIRSTPQRPARAWLAAGAVAIVVAGLAGAGVSTSIAGSRSAAAEARASATRDASATRGASSPATGLGSNAVAESLGEEYFDQAQSPGDRPDVILPGIDASTTRRVLAQWGQQDGEAGVWVARGTDHSFCLIMSVGSTRGASSCTPLADAASTGVRLDLVTAGGASISARWNLAAGLLELSPFPAVTDDSRSGTATPKP